MNDGKYDAIRNYLEELASQGRQLIEGQARTNELLDLLRRPEERMADAIWKAANASKVDAPPYTGTLETEPPPAASKAQGSAKKGK